MKYYLVAVLNREANKELELIQRPLFRRGKNFKKPPYMAIPIDIIEEPDKDKLQAFLTELLKPFRYFHVEIQGNYYQSPEKILGLPISNFGYIKKLQRHLNEYMNLAGYNASPEKKDSDYFILSMSQEKPPREFDREKKLFPNEPENKKKFLVDRIELWKALGAKKESIVFSIPLKNPKIL